MGVLPTGRVGLLYYKPDSESPKAGNGSRSIRKTECTHGEHGLREGKGKSWEQDAQLLPEEGEMKSDSRVTSELKFDPRDEF